MMKAKRVLALLLCLVMVLSYVPSHIHAAGGATNVYMTLGSTEVSIGDTFTVTLSHNNMTVSSFTAGIKFDKDLLECVAVDGPMASVDPSYASFFYLTKAGVPAFMATVQATAVSTPAQANANGQVGFAVAATADATYTGQLLYTVTFKAKADGNAVFALYEDSAGTDGHKNDSIETQTVTIGGGVQEPTCQHNKVSAVSLGNGKHKLVCANPDCGEVQEESVPCSGGTATCKELAECVACGAKYGELGGHAYGTLIPAQAEIHKVDELKAGVAAHYECSVCHKLFTEAMAETTIEELTGKTPAHNPGADATCGKDQTCTVCGKVMTAASGNHTFDNDCDATCNGCDYTRVVAGHTSDATNDCEEGTCTTCGTTVPATKEHEVDPTKTTTNVTKAPTCTEEGTEDVYTFCACGHAFDSFERSVPVNPDAHNWGTVAYNWSADYTAYTAKRTCEKGCEETAEADVITSVFKPATCVDPGWTNLVADFNVDWAVDQNTNVPNIPVNSNNHNGVPNSTTYADNGDGTHTVTVTCQCNAVLSTETVDHTYVDGKCVCEAVEHVCEPDEYINNGDDHTVKCECGAELGTEAHDYTNDAEAHKCVCGAVEMFTLTVSDLEAAYGDAGPDYYRVPFGTNILDFLGGLNIVDTYVVNNEVRVGYYRLDNWNDSDCNLIESDTTVTADLEILAAGPFFGWERYDEEAPWSYSDELGNFVEGWYKIDGAWYYFVKAENGWHYIAQGLTRVPYPTEAINGITYAPNQEDIDYAASKGQTFIDESNAWFVFGEDGKFQSNLTGINEKGAYIANGMIAWHPGAVDVDGEAYYFVGDPVNGGNKFAQGDVFTTRCNGINAFVEGACYNFVDGQLSGNNGMVDGKYYENSRLMFANGLTKVEEGYIYVNSKGEYITGKEYWVPANNLGIVPGMYRFDENGFMVEPETTDKNGVFAENGGLYYYVDGKLAYNLGLIAYENGYIYVRSNGKLAVGEYYVSNVADNHESGVKAGMKVTFGENGFMVALKNGVVDGKYYVNGQLAYNAGVVEVDGKYIYVRSNGEIVIGKDYWITNVGDSGLTAKKYTFDDNGIMQDPEIAKNGIVDGVYYVDGKIAYCAGLIKMADENGEFYIYVRSNGELATGSYWPTNKNGIDVKGALDFGVDGKSYI